MACRWHQTARSPNLFGAAAWRATKEMACRWHSDSGRLISLVSLVPQHRLGRAGHRVRQRARPAEVWTCRIKEMVQPMICLHAVSLVLRTAHTAHTARPAHPLLYRCVQVCRRGQRDDPRLHRGSRGAAARRTCGQVGVHAHRARARMGPPAAAADRLFRW